MKPFCLGVVALLSAGLAQPASAANCATVSFSGPSTITGWNPLTSSTGTGTITATATRVTTGTTVRSARIIFLDNDTGATKVGQVGAQVGPDYEIRDSTAALVSAPAGSSPSTSPAGAQFSWGNGTNNTATASFTLSLLPNSTSQEFVGNTTYTEALKYSVQCFGAPPSSTPLLADTQVAGPTLSYTIPSVLSITTAAPNPIDFGSFTATTANTTIGVRSTASVDVNVSTASGSQMVRAGAVPPFPANSVIPYTMTLNGTAITTGVASTNLPRAKVAGTSWPFVLNLTGGLPSGKIAGSYGDTITLTLTPGL